MSGKATISATFTLESIEAFIQQKTQRVQQAMINVFQLVGEEAVTKARSKVADEGYSDLLREYGINSKSLGSIAHGRSVEITEDTPSFNDITGNLRSSIGYVILQDGKQLITNFEESARGTEKAEGLATGQSVAEAIASEFPKGIVLIIVAGMKYAVYVESKGRDVITGSTLELPSRIKELLQQI